MDIKIFVLLLLVVCGLSSPEIQSDPYRVLIKEQNKKMVDQHNQRPSARFEMKLYDRFASKTYEQLVELMLKTKMPSQIALKVAPRPQVNSLLGTVGWGPHLYVNWTARGKVPNVTDQGYCGSCYAHVAVSDIETSYRFRNKDLNLSTQQIVDCSWRFGNLGCVGGWMGQVFDYVKINGITTRQKYPDRQQTFWTAIEGKCDHPRGQFRVRRFAYTSYRIYDCDSLTNMVQQRPVTVAVTANTLFMFYLRGIFDMCGPIIEGSINHAMVVAGVVQNQRQNYWFLKNSWGTYWGEQGYMRLDRGKDYGNHCQICYAPHYSIL